MAEFEAGGLRYRTKPMCVADQWALLDRLRPILPALKGMDISLRSEDGNIENVALALAPLIGAADDDMSAVFRMCLATIERRDGEVWTSVEEAPPLAALMRIATQVVSENFMVLFAMKRPKFNPIPFDRVQYEPVTMPENDEWLYRPVLRGLCRIESLYDGSLRIEHLAKLNDALDVDDENQARARKAAEKK